MAVNLLDPTLLPGLQDPAMHANWRNAITGFSATNGASSRCARRTRLTWHWSAQITFVSSYVRKPPTCVYLVIQIGTQWWVDREGKTFGPCESKEVAEAGAFKLIDVFGDPARRMEVWSPDENGKMRLVWKGQAGD